MYTIPLDVDLDKLKGKAIIQICYTVNTISFFFEDIGFIGVEGSFLFNDGDKLFSDNNRIDISEMFPLNKDCGLLDLLEKKLTNIEINQERTDLTFYFDENKSLTLFGDPHYESYDINIDGRRITI